MTFPGFVSRPPDDSDRVVDPVDVVEVKSRYPVDGVVVLVACVAAGGCLVALAAIAAAAAAVVVALRWAVG